MTATQTRHFVAVWNPAYARNALEEHLAVLLDRVREADAASAGEEDLYVWWGKVRSTNRMAPQRHMEDIRAIAASLDADEGDAEVALYLTDYRSLYVGEVDAMHMGALPESEERHRPAYYAEKQLICDFWFRLRDIRRLVVDDTRAVIEELRGLRNVHYHDKPVSIYGGMIDLPLIVTRADDRRFFDPDERELLTDGRLWVEFDAEQGTGIGAIERSLREDLFGESAWSALEPSTRTFIATAEKLFRDHRGDPSFDFGPVLTAFSKSIEAQANGTLRRVLPRLAPEARRANINGRTVDLLEHRSLTLGELAHAIGGERELNAALLARLENGSWFAGSFPAIASSFAGARNDGAHARRIDRETATRWRNQLVGVGCVGELVQLARVIPAR